MEYMCESLTTTNLSYIEELARRFSYWDRMKRCVAAVASVFSSESSVRGTKSKHVSLEDLRNAECKIWTLVQDEAFAKEKDKLMSDSQIPTSSKLIEFNPILKDGLICIGGRLKNSSLQENAKHPIILPHDSHAVMLLVRRTHEINGHCGQNHLMALLREKYWIIRANGIVKRVIRKCVHCKMLSLKPMTQEMASLPSIRVSSTDPVFTYTGADCFGPFLIKQGRSEVKKYGLIFTCLSVRAVHIEILDTLETDSFINALRRFVARRGSVKQIWCDNGTNFVGAEKELRVNLMKLDQGSISRECCSKEIEWHFNPPTASHFGGAWERLIRSVRRTLKSICAQQVFNSSEVLATLLCEAEAIINSRPLTRVTSDQECLATIFPNMLLTYRGESAPINETDSRDIYSRKRWKQVQYLAQVFWRRWTSEYLPLLQRRQKWTTLRQNLTPGSIVLSLDEKTPRGTWPMGRVLKVFKSADGNVRKALIKTERGEYLRPISKLCLLLEDEI